MKKTEQKLRNAIADILKAVKQNDFPVIYNFIQTDKGYKRIEDMMIKMFINENVKLSAALINIERML